MRIPFIAEAAADPSVSGLVSYGGVGILAAALLWAVRELWSREKQSADHHRDRAERAEAEVKRLNDVIQSSLVPRDRAEKAETEVRRLNDAIQSSMVPRERAEKAEAEVQRLNDVIQSSTIPAVVKATEVMGQMLAKTRQRGPS